MAAGSRVAPRRARDPGNAAGLETRQRIVTTAERLFARHGLDAVSVRDITTAARVNTAAINYHFGTKRGLVVAVLERRAQQLGERRAELLDLIERDPSPTLRDVVAALVIPTAELASDRRRGGYFYVGFLASVLDHPEYVKVVANAFDEITNRYLVALARVTPHLPSDVREFRFAFAKDFINRSLVLPPHVHHWIEQHAPGADDALTDRIIDFVTGAFAGPAVA